MVGFCLSIITNCELIMPKQAFDGLNITYRSNDQHIEYLNPKSFELQEEGQQERSL